jgi:hypothetical protein
MRRIREGIYNREMGWRERVHNQEIREEKDMEARECSLSLNTGEKDCQCSHQGKDERGNLYSTAMG